MKKITVYMDNNIVIIKDLTEVFLMKEVLLPF